MFLINSGELVRVIGIGKILRLRRAIMICFLVNYYDEIDFLSPLNVCYLFFVFGSFMGIYCHGFSVVYLICIYYFTFSSNFICTALSTF